MEYRHRVVQGLSDLIDKYGGGGKDPFMRAIWMGLKSQVPHILSALDNSEEAIAEIEAKLREVLDIKEPPKKELVVVPLEEPLSIQTEPGPEITEPPKLTKKQKRQRKEERKKKKKEAIEAAEAEITVEPAEE